MKKIAFILLLIFAMVQLAPAVRAAVSGTTNVFIADEEKGEDKGHSIDKKDKKDYAAFSSQSAYLTHKTGTSFHVVDNIYPSPVLETITPPPNFC